MAFHNTCIVCSHIVVVFFCSMSGLNCVLSICMGSSFDVDVDGNGITCANFLGLLVTPNASFINIKNMLLQQEI